MQTFKYIVKRILLSILILFGVSIIIYMMSRMMPTDFIDNQYAGQLAQGNMTYADVDRIKEIYGLAMPDAYLTIVPGANSEFSGVEFTKSAKALDKEEIDNYKIKDNDEYDGLEDYKLEAIYELSYKWYSDSYDAKIKLNGEKKKSDVRLYIYGKGANADQYKIFKVISGGVVVSKDEEDGKEENKGDDENKEDNSVIVIEEELVELESGTFSIDIGDGLSSLAAITLTNSDGVAAEAKMSYRLATGGEKAGAMFTGYFTWLGNMLKGDLGMSFKHKAPVSEVIMENMWISFAIALIATILQFLIAIPLGIKAATSQYGVIDYVVTIFTMMGISLPTFFLGAIFIRIFAVQFGWFPVNGLLDPLGDVSWFAKAGNVLWHMVMPMTVLVILSIGSLMRYTRTNTLEVLNSDYIRTARAKGLSESKVVYKHAFRNTLIPLVTLLAGILPSLFGGAMITEQVFGIPGIGQLAYQALMVSDIPFIMGYNMFIAILTVIGTLFSDLMYAVVDPRVKLGR